MIEPEILFEDDFILVVNKPAGLIVNKADTSVGQPTLQEWIEKKIGVVSNESSEFLSRSGIVHRLDKETSGVIVVAKDEETFLELQRQFKSREVEKTYEALVHGKVTPTEGEVNAPIGRLPWDRKKFGVIAEGRESKTIYKVLKEFSTRIGKKEEKLTLVNVYPKTGRTHQIRVHFKYLGFPIFSDSTYAGRKTARDDRKLLTRHFLHAKKIKIVHPKRGESMEFEASLPTELVDFIASLS